MLLSEFDFGPQNGRRVRSPGRCIYCYTASPKLTDEHAIPYALAANALVIENSCCEVCQKIIQPYEQAVLKKQLGIFRAQVDAPTRNKRDRPKEVELQFFEVDSEGQPVRALGHRAIPIAQAPVMFNLWQSPPPRLLRDAGSKCDESGAPWCHYDEEAIKAICRTVANEEGIKNVAMRLGVVNRIDYLRSIAKTAHAYAVAELGLDAFEPILLDLILCRSDDVGDFVGDALLDSPVETDPAHTLQVLIGELTEGPAQGYLVARLQLYPMFHSPQHVVVLGRAIEDIGKRFVTCG